MPDSLESRVESLEAQVRELQDIREINDLFHKWHYACTGGFSGVQAGRMEALDVLTDDATIEIEGLHEPGKGPRGRDEYTKYWEYYFGDNGPLPYVFQTSLGEKVELHGDTAIQYTNMLGIFQARDQPPTIGVTRRRNWLIRTPDGWRIEKTTTEGGLSAPLSELIGRLNQLPPQEDRKPWTYGGE
jgi:hypothetical protein